MSEQPCVGCGRSTRVGTRLFSDRSTARDGDSTLYICGDCNVRAVSHFGRRPTGADMKQIATRAGGWMGAA